MFSNTAIAIPLTAVQDALRTSYSTVVDFVVPSSAALAVAVATLESWAAQLICCICMVLAKLFHSSAGALSSSLKSSSILERLYTSYSQCL